jgi:ectoine hydroxylase-related dioxygenase (phytanoyl-CoA dioxygenase family)
MNFQHLKAQYDRDGYVIVRELLPPADFTELRENLDRYVREVVPNLPETDAFYDVDRSRPETLRQLHRMDQDPYFAAYVRNPIWVSLAEALVGEKVSALAPEWFNKPPGSVKGTPPHQDNYYFCFDPPHVLTIWMAMDAVDDENACMRFLPGSHREGVRPHARSQIMGFSQHVSDYGPQDTAREVPIHMQPGDVSVHHGNLIHLAGANRSTTRHRRAFAIVFRGESCRRDEAAYQRYLSAAKAHQEALTSGKS